MTAPLDALWYTRCAVPNSFGLAMSHGWIEDRLSGIGIPIRSIKEADDPRIRESHFDHSQPNSLRYGGSSPALWARASGRETRALGLQVTRESQLIVTRPDSGIQSPGDLKGRRFGLPLWVNQQIDFLRAQALRGLENVLELAGLTLADVEIVDFPVGATFAGEKVHRIPGTETFGTRKLAGGSAELRGLVRGDVDAIFLHGATGLYISNLLELDVVFDLASHPDPLVRANNGSPIVLTMDRALLDNAHEVAAAVIGELLKAEDRAALHPEEVRQIAAREVNVSEYWLWRAYGGDQGLALRTTLDEDAVAALQSFADFLHRHRFIPAPVDVASWVDPAPLAAARALIHAEV
ncbi:ABC transporter substrate-binding protein [Tsuneonella sp. CC-YZS046]|uniref:ABC transporter substrate-binding protein n=1 Tax=Tsuneonella sp. CC-YZS046 TaxID=3042152 RepID=UPI002D78F20C|nr:ABC transporter substrate-binding protein [Tsuneonella sp. CC-YZS046]WRO66627.1 ABC transporter substrate-binding protein [Tsuneonella sp. CC-YZS046]